MRRLPFDERFHDAIRAGRKRMTVRTRRFGRPGDVLSTEVGRVELEAVEPIALGVAVEQFFADDGFSSPDDFKSFWNALHPRTGYRPERRVYLHRFRLVL